MLLATLLVFAGCVQSAVVVIEDEVTELTHDRSAEVKAYRDRRLVSAFKGDLDGAITDFTAAIEISLGRAASYLYRGNAYAIMGDHHRAIADYDRAIGIDPGLAEAYLGRGDAHAAVQAYDQAMADYNQALKINGALGPVYVNRARLYHTGFREVYKACADWESARSLGQCGPLRRAEDCVADPLTPVILTAPRSCRAFFAPCE